MEGLQKSNTEPFSNILVRDGYWGHLPWAAQLPPGEPLEVKLTADLGVGTTGVRDVVRVEGHHVTKHVCAPGLI